jgi:16S rRNA processing protein RimM
VGNPDNSADLIAVGVIGKAFGIHGELKVTPYGPSLELLDVPSAIFVGPVPENVKEMRLVEKRGASGRMVCRLEGVEDPNAAEAFCRWEIYRRRDELPALDKDSYYHNELEGMTVFLGSPGSSYGTVKAVTSYPTLDALEVIKPDGSEVTIPFTLEMIQKVDREKRIVLINPEALGDL